jgi:hypothetical protein
MTTKKTLARLQRAEQRALAHWLEIPARRGPS